MGKRVYYNRWMYRKELNKKAKKMRARMLTGTVLKLVIVFGEHLYTFQFSWKNGQD